MSEYVDFQRQYEVKCVPIIHLRKSARIVELHQEYARDGRLVVKGRKHIPMDSVIGLLLSAIACGTVLTVEAKVKAGSAEQFHDELSDIFGNPDA